MSTVTVEAHGLEKQYGRTRALRPLDLTVRQGTCLGLVGVNGAGKSTLLKMLAGILQPSGGRVTVLGEAPGPATKLHVAYMPEVDHCYPTWTGREAYEFMRRMFPMNRARFDRTAAFF